MQQDLGLELSYNTQLLKNERGKNMNIKEEGWGRERENNKQIVRMKRDKKIMFI